MHSLQAQPLRPDRVDFYRCRAYEHKTIDAIMDACPDLRPHRVQVMRAMLPDCLCGARAGIVFDCSGAVLACCSWRSPDPLCDGRSNLKICFTVDPETTVYTFAGSPVEAAMRAEIETNQQRFTGIQTNYRSIFDA